MEQTRNENGITYVNHESVPVKIITHTDGNLKAIGEFLLDCGVKHGDQIIDEDNCPYLCCVEPYREANPEHPWDGDVYVIFPNKKVILYAAGEFKANFKWK